MVLQAIGISILLHLIELCKIGLYTHSDFIEMNQGSENSNVLWKVLQEICFSKEVSYHTFSFHIH